MLQKNQAGIIINIKVIPKSSFNKINGFRNDELLIKTTATPEKGLANKAVIKILSKELKIPKSHLEIISGTTSSHKKVLCHEISKIEINRKLMAIIHSSC